MIPRIGAYYLFGAILLACASYLLRPLGWLLLWPAASLFLVALGYAGLGARVYRKHSGNLPSTSLALHCFTLLGHELSRRHYAKGCEPWSVLSPGLWIGRQLTEKEAEHLPDRGITAVLDLTAEFSEPQTLRKLDYRNVPILDLTAPSSFQLQSALDFLDQASACGGITYIHCKIGYSRTAAVAGCYLLRSGQANNADEAIAKLRKARPSIVIRPEAENTIRHFAESCPPS